MSLPRRLSKASEEVRSEFGLQRGRVVCQTLRRRGIPSLGHTSLYKGILFTSSHFIPARPGSFLIYPLRSLPSHLSPLCPSISNAQNLLVPSADASWAPDRCLALKVAHELETGIGRSQPAASPDFLCPWTYAQHHEG